MTHVQYNRFVVLNIIGDLPWQKEFQAQFYWTATTQTSQHYIL